MSGRLWQQQRILNTVSEASYTRRNPPTHAAHGDAARLAQAQEEPRKTGTGDTCPGEEPIAADGDLAAPPIHGSRFPLWG